MAKFGCILINFNGLEDTLTCIESIQKTQCFNLKIFLVNNSASDGSGIIFTKQLGSQSLEYKYLEPSENLGFAAACNYASKSILSDSTLTHIVILNNDIVVDSNFGYELEKATQAYPDSVIAGTVLDSITGKPSFNIGKFSFFTHQIKHIFSDDKIVDFDFVSGCMVVIPSRLFQELGGFFEDYFMYWEDAELSIRIKEKGINLIHWPSLKIVHALSSSVNRSRVSKEYYRIRNQTHFIFHHARQFQKVLYLGYLLGLLIHRILIRPREFKNSFQGALDGLLSRLGKKID